MLRVTHRWLWAFPTGFSLSEAEVVVRVACDSESAFQESVQMSAWLTLAHDHHDCHVLLLDQFLSHIEHFSWLSYTLLDTSSIMDDETAEIELV